MAFSPRGRRLSKRPPPPGIRAPKRARGRGIGVAVGVALAFGLAGGLALGAACLPDLANLAAPGDTGDGAGANRPDGALGGDGGTFPPPDPAVAICGNGLVEGSEQCDPGTAPSAFCTAKCMVVCAPGGVFDPSSNHCYALVKEFHPFGAAHQACFNRGAHLVTFASYEELSLVETGFRVSSLLAPIDLFWVGLARLGTSDTYGAYDMEEPGFGLRCPGCYARNARPDNLFLPLVTAPPAPDGGSAPPAACVVAAASGAVWNELDCADPGTAYTICEREYVGQRFRDCGTGTLCLSLPRTIASGKRYLYVPTPAGPDAAAHFCSALSRGRLVVFASNEEREQLMFELLKPASKVFDSTAQFWIGLSRGLSSTPGPADGVTYYWDDGTVPGQATRTAPWGDREPLATGPSRAFLLRKQQVTPGAHAEDTLLAHADSTVASLPYVCEYYP